MSTTHVVVPPQPDRQRLFKAVLLQGHDVLSVDVLQMILELIEGKKLHATRVDRGLSIDIIRQTLYRTLRLLYNESVDAEYRQEFRFTSKLKRLRSNAQKEFWIPLLKECIALHVQRKQKLDAA
jgi:hypothetical protein